MSFFVYIDGILGIKINNKNFSWSFGTVAPESDEEAFNKCKIKVFLETRNSNDVFESTLSRERLGKYHYFLASQGENKIYYERDFLGTSKLRYSIHVVENNVHVVVGQNYMKYIKHRFMGLHSMGYILTDMIAGLLLMNGISTIHCSAVRGNDQSIVIFAPPNTGKTLTSIQLCKKNGFKFIAEDFALTDGENLWSVPWTSTFRYYDDINNSRTDTLINRLTKFLPVLELVPLKKNKSIDTYLGRERIEQFSAASDVVVLERGESKLSKDSKEGLRKIINLNRYEFNYHKSPAVVAMNYFNPDFSPEGMFETEKSILRRLVSNCRYLCISEKNALNYAEVVLKEVVRS